AEDVTTLRQAALAVGREEVILAQHAAVDCQRLTKKWLRLGIAPALDKLRSLARKFPCGADFCLGFGRKGRDLRCDLNAAAGVGRLPVLRPLYPSAYRLDLASRSLGFGEPACRLQLRDLLFQFLNPFGIVAGEPLLDRGLLVRRRSRLGRL